MSEKTRDLFSRLEQFQLEQFQQEIPSHPTTRDNYYSYETPLQQFSSQALASETNFDSILSSPININKVFKDNIRDNEEYGLGITYSDDEDFDYDLYSGTITRDTSIHSLSVDLKDVTKDLNVLKQSIDNNKLILDCIEDMLHQENEQIMNSLNDIINDIQTSVANNTVVIRGDYFNR
ncbi:hypothetical protein CLIB1444_02S14378 [[Candida] jaroonii]|uniref:Uncharacterized protein n=1 Tax=[Candida] jaroonii TaxID=467808 RepID=A0ACA9Y3Z1_9ASCO|nr:hypothetical protein CLIB1444_02S14378 [[Candida] jaroonii]